MSTGNTNSAHKPFVDLAVPLCVEEQLHQLAIVPKVGTNTKVDEIITKMQEVCVCETIYNINIKPCTS